MESREKKKRKTKTKNKEQKTYQYFLAPPLLLSFEEWVLQIKRINFIMLLPAFWNNTKQMSFVSVLDLFLFYSSLIKNNRRNVF